MSFRLGVVSRGGSFSGYFDEYCWMVVMGKLKATASSLASRTSFIGEPQKDPQPRGWGNHPQKELTWQLAKSSYITDRFLGNINAGVVANQC